MAAKIKVPWLNNEELGLFYSENKWVILSILSVFAVCLESYTRGSNYDFWLTDEIFQKTKMEDKK